ncbi:MAG: hypothetical protein FD135_1354 [Comamonadaceae bacterium]|nr:MAG: hypothetical protein FD135_1354 [Comamonadaceae bacterium]
MSYVLQIWESPIPNSVTEADQIHDRLSEQHTAQNPKFIELAKRLTKRYPSAGTSGGDDEETEDVWSDSPIDGETDSPVYGLGVQTEHLNAVVPFVVKTANTLGLTVYDTQAGQAFLPNGKVLTLPRQAPVQFDETDTSDELTSRNQVEKLVLKGLKGVLKKHGFKPGKRGGDQVFEKKTEGFNQRISIYVTSKEIRKYLITPLVSIEINQGHDILKHLFNYSIPYILITSNVDNFCKQIDSTEQAGIREIEVMNAADVDHAITKIITYFEDHVFPALEECHSILGVDKYMNTSPFGNCPLRGGGGDDRFVIQLIVAHLAKNKNYATLVTDFLEAADQYQKNCLEKAIPYLNQLSHGA